MPIACSQTVLTGQDGSVRFKPAGTTFCLLDWTDFPAGTDITVPLGHDFRLGDPIVFTEIGAGNLVSALTPGTTYYVVAKAATTIKVSATSGGTAITITANGGTGSADTAGNANHVRVTFADFAAVCQVTSWSLNISRDEIDTVSLPCGPTANDPAAAPFRTRQAGYADGSGTMEVRFSSDQTGFARRLLQNSLRRDQNGAEVQLFIDTQYSGGVVSTANSLYFQAPISILGFDMGVTPEESTTATLNFSVSAQPSVIF
jgi:hypothetical protein